MARGWSNSLATLPGAVVSLLPTATCPACLGAYAGLVSALGVGFLFKQQVLLPLIAVFLLIGLAGAIVSRRRHHCSGPLLLTFGGSLLVALGRIIWNIPTLVYAVHYCWSSPRSGICGSEKCRFAPDWCNCQRGNENDWRMLWLRES